MTLAMFLAPETVGVAGAQTPPTSALVIQWPTNGGTNQMWRPAVSGL